MSAVRIYSKTTHTRDLKLSKSNYSNFLMLLFFLLVGLGLYYEGDQASDLTSHIAQLTYILLRGIKLAIWYKDFALAIGNLTELS